MSKATDLLELLNEKAEHTVKAVDPNTKKTVKEYKGSAVNLFSTLEKGTWADTVFSINGKKPVDLPTAIKTLKKMQVADNKAAFKRDVDSGRNS